MPAYSGATLRPAHAPQNCHIGGIFSRPHEDPADPAWIGEASPRLRTAERRQSGGVRSAHPSRTSCGPPLHKSQRSTPHRQSRRLTSPPRFRRGGTCHLAIDSLIPDETEQNPNDYLDTPNLNQISGVLPCDPISICRTTKQIRLGSYTKSR
jgi:hypothetical protein